MRTYTVSYRIKDTFPIARDDTWVVRQGNRVVEKWRVDWVNEKNTHAEITVTEYEEDENASWN